VAFSPQLNGSGQAADSCTHNKDVNARGLQSFHIVAFEE
jgi:hypothetical protein